MILPRTSNRNLLSILIIFLIFMSINLLLNDYCDFLMTTVYAFLHTRITTAMKLIFLI